MKAARMPTNVAVALGLMFCQAYVSQAAAIGTAFTYQGHLYDANYPADGLYDLQFKLYDSNDPCDCNQIGADVNVADMEVIEGYFTVSLDFNDANAFNGDARWLEIGVRAGEINDPSGYTALVPRQEVTAAPYVLHAKVAESTAAGGYAETDPTVAASVKDGVDWSEVTSMPAGFADDIDDDTRYEAGVFLELAGATFNVLPLSGVMIWDGSLRLSAIDQNSGATVGQVIKWDGSAWVAADDSMNADPDWTISGPNMYSGAAGNVGIGTSAPAHKLHVVGDANITGNLYAGSGSTVLFVDDANDRLGIGTMSPSAKLDVAGGAAISGNVGIGTTSPVAALDVNGAAKILGWHDQQVDPNGYAWVGSILFQWGTRASTSDSSEWFDFPIEFPTACFAVSPALPGVVVPDTGGFYLDRHDDYGPTHIFRFLAIGH
ncbi:MAG: hypothetical protein JSW23_00560 [Planctomycetota bacterium]|nr:MAG: hypothetical protein JSW23_00560 [Planctomycetota bacterium]